MIFNIVNNFPEGVKVRYLILGGLFCILISSFNSISLAQENLSVSSNPLNKNPADSKGNQGQALTTMAHSRTKIAIEPLPKSGTLSLSFKEAIQKAIQYNFNVLLAQEKIKESKGKSLQALSPLLPNLSGTGTQARQKISLTELGFTPGLFPGLGSTLGPFDTFDARISVVQSIFSLSDIQNYESKRENQLITKLEESLAKEQASAAAGLAYLNLQRALSLVQAAQSDFQLAQYFSQLVNDQYKAGITNTVDLARAATEISIAQSALIQAQTDAQTNDLNLKRVIGLPLDTPINLTDVPNSTASQTPSIEDALKIAQNSRLELEIARDQVKMKSHDEKSAIGKQIPSLSVAANYGGGGTTPDENFAQLYYVGVQVNLPLFNGGNTIGQIEESKSQKHQAQLILNDFEVQLEQEVRNSLQTVILSYKELEAAQQSLNLVLKEIDLAKNQFKSGTGDSLALVQTQNLLAKARGDYVTALAQYQGARINLAISLGQMEGFQL